MALKFGSLFDGLGAGFESALDGVAKRFASKVDASGFEEASGAMSDTAKAAAAAAAQIVNLENQLTRTTVGTAEYIRIEKELNSVKEQAKTLSEQQKDHEQNLNEERQKTIDSLGKEINTRSRHQNTLSNIQAQFEKDQTELFNSFRAGSDDVNQLKKDLAKLELKTLGKNLGAQLSSGDVQGTMNAAGNFAANTFQNALTKVLPPGMSQVAEFITDRLIDAFSQVMELNKELVNLERSTGGVVSAAKLGYDAMGNSAEGFKSLKTAAVEANISVEEFSGAMKSLVSAGFQEGIIGAIKPATDELQAFGVQSARMQKMYSAELGPAVAKFMNDFGMRMGDAANFVGNAADKAQSLGLNVQGFIENLTAVANLAGEVYFKSREEMQKMATIASQLGVSVNTLASGLVKMTNMNDLFSQQQKAASLGLSSLSKNLGQVYALQKTGRGGEAAKLQVTSIAQDLAKQGLINKEGQVSQQGIETLSAAGLDKEAIAGIQKMAREAQQSGIALSKLGDTSKLTKEEQERLNAVQRANMTIGEQGNQILGSLKQAFIDPLAAIIGPVLKGLMNAIQPIAKAIGSVVKFIYDGLSPIVGYVMTIFDEVSKMFQDIWEPIASLFANVGSVGGGFFQTLKDISSFIAKVFMVPFRILSKIIGGVISVFAKLWGVVAEKLGPIFESVSSVFKDGMAWIEDSLGWITDAFGFVGDLLGNILGGIIDGVIFVFKGLGTVLGWVVDGFTWLIDGISWLIDNSIQPLIDGFTWLWEVLDEYIISPITEFLSPAFEFLGEVIDDLTAPFKWLWEQLESFGNWLADWFGSDDEETSKQAQGVMTDWGQLLGDVLETTTPSIPNAGNIVSFTPSSTSSDNAISERLMNQAFTPPGESKKTTNVVVNNTVSGIVSSEQSIKAL